MGAAASVHEHQPDVEAAVEFDQQTHRSAKGTNALPGVDDFRRQLLERYLLARDVQTPSAQAQQQTRATGGAPRERLFQRRGEAGAHRIAFAPYVLLRGRRLNVLHTPSLGQESAHACLERLQTRNVGRAQPQVFVDAGDLRGKRNVVEDRVCC